MLDIYSQVKVALWDDFAQPRTVFQNGGKVKCRLKKRVKGEKQHDIDKQLFV